MIAHFCSTFFSTKIMAGGSYCCVASCTNNSKQNKNLRFHSFPQDPILQKEWITKCHRKEEFDPKFRRICSRHFLPEDYEDDLQARLLGTMPKKLRKDAIPTLHLLPEFDTVAQEPTHLKRLQTTKRKGGVMQTSLNKRSAISNEEVEDNHLAGNSENILLQRVTFLEEEIEEVKEQFSNYQEKMLKKMETLEKSLKEALLLLKNK